MARLFRVWVVGVVVLGTVFCVRGWAIALLVQSDDIWKYRDSTVQPYEALTNQGISYDRIRQEDVSTVSFSGYDFIYLVGSADENNAFITNSIPIMNTKYANYVNQGGLLLIHFADWSSDDLLNNIAPGEVGRIRGFTNTGTIVPGKETDSIFNGISDDDLDNWSATAHGYLTDLPANAEILVVNEDSNPIYARYKLGLGEVWVTTMTLEWALADHDFLNNELKLAKERQANNVVPEPASFGLLLTGMLLGMIGRRRKVL